MTAHKSFTAIVAIILLVVAVSACDRTITTTEAPPQTASNCFDCHSDQNTILIAAHTQWANSIHASGYNTDRNNSSCSGCHTSEGFVARAQGGTPGTYPNATIIHCFTCHAPHTNSAGGLNNGGFALRIEDPQTLADGSSYDLGEANICSACHQARRDVNTYVRTANDTTNINSTHWGPHHGPQSDNLIGANGYTYVGYTYEQTNHKMNPNACLSCHFEVTQNFVVGGHSFNMRGVIIGHEHDPIEDVVNQAACEQCHNMDTTTEFNYNDRQTETLALADSLATLLENAGLWTNGHPVSGNLVSNDEAGAVWNLLMYEEDRSKGIHNYKWLKGLLESSIWFMEGSLPQTAAPAVAGGGDVRNRHAAPSE